MKTFGGTPYFLDKNDINTDEIIPAKYLTEISKAALKPHLLEDLLIEGDKFDNQDPALRAASVIVTRKNFGCGSSREHAVWAFEVNDISVIIAESFARIFRQNMFNCGILAIELEANSISELFSLSSDATISVDLENTMVIAQSPQLVGGEKQFHFTLNEFDKDLVKAGGWLSYADKKY
ncbi:MAG: 3-isopropylmalate dehydratase small subunit [Desulfobulbaceae bacterium]|nr:MAG: 3-isopropylmalate dehydratase small subunit [Desulfobulbaceae bacterium]